MAYKFQIGESRLSGSLIQEGQLNVYDDNGNEKFYVTTGGAVNADGAITAGGNVTAVGSFIIGSADMSESDLEKLDGITDGTAAANKALVLDASSDVTGINALGIASMASNWTNASRTVADMGTVTTMDLNGGSIDGTAIGASSATTAKFTTLDASQNTQLGATLGVTGAASLGATLDVTGIVSGSAAGKFVSLDVNNGALTVSAAGAAVAFGSVTAGSSFIIGSADLNETDMEKLDGITDGTAAANKALVLDASSDVSGINALGIASMASNWTNASRTVADMGTVTTMDLNGGSIDGTTIGASAQAAAEFTTVSGSGAFQGGSTAVFATSVTAGTSFIIGSADLNETDMEKLDGITDGTAAANKALVLDASKDVTGINDLGIATMASNWTNAGRTVADMGILTTVDINGGSVDGTTIGASSQSTGQFTTLSGSSTLEVGGTVTTNGDTYLGKDNTAAYHRVSGSAFSVEPNADFQGTVNAIGAVTLDSTLNVAGASTLDGNVTLGNASSDDLTFTGRAASDLVPKTDSAYDLGTSALQWAELHLDTGYIDQLGAALDANAQNITNVGTFEVDGAASFNGNVDLGDATGDTVTFTGRVDSSIVPDADSSRDLGTSALRWSTIYVDSIVGADVALDTEGYGNAPLGTTVSASTDFALLEASSTTYTLPTAVAGKVLHIKLSGSISNATLSAASGDTLEDGGTVILESTGSAVTLVAHDATHWFIV